MSNTSLCVHSREKKQNKKAIPTKNVASIQEEKTLNVAGVATLTGTARH